MKQQSKQIKIELEEQGYELKFYPVEDENYIRGKFTKYKAEAFKDGDLIHSAISFKDYDEAVDFLYHQLKKLKELFKWVK